MIFDRYFDFSTISVTRTKWSGDQETRYCFMGSTPLPRPSNWTTCISIEQVCRTSNEFFAKRLVETVKVGAGKIFSATCNENVLLVPHGGINVDSL